MMTMTYFHRLALNSGVPCFAALPGTYADLEKGVALPVMLVPTTCGVLRRLHEVRWSPFYTTYLGVSLDSEGRHYGRSAVVESATSRHSKAGSGGWRVPCLD